MIWETWKLSWPKLPPELPRHQLTKRRPVLPASMSSPLSYPMALPAIANSNNRTQQQQLIRGCLPPLLQLMKVHGELKLWHSTAYNKTNIDQQRPLNRLLSPPPTTTHNNTRLNLINRIHSTTSIISSQLQMRRLPIMQHHPKVIYHQIRLSRPLLSMNVLDKPRQPGHLIMRDAKDPTRRDGRGALMKRKLS